MPDTGRGTGSTRPNSAPVPGASGSGRYGACGSRPTTTTPPIAPRRRPTDS